MYKNLQNLTPYVAGEQPKSRVIKLNTNENPYPPSPATLNLSGARNLQLYPDPSCERLCQIIANREGLKPSNVFVGNGSDEVLAMAFMALFDFSDVIAAPKLTYSFYPVYAKLFNLNFKQVEMNADYSVNVDGLISMGNCIVLANPNAPTGIALPLNQILRMASQRFVLVDEAYINFGGETASAYISKNLCVVRTLSKAYSLAGARVGYLLGTEDVVSALNTVKNCFNSYTVGSYAQLLAINALQDEEYYAHTTAQIVAERNKTAERLRKMGYEVLPSSANFVFVRAENAKDLYLYLKERGILVRYFSDIPSFLRITIGTQEDMQQFFTALEQA